MKQGSKRRGANCLLESSKLISRTERRSNARPINKPDNKDIQGKIALMNRQIERI